jgi:hypothetical protein
MKYIRRTLLDLHVDELRMFWVRGQARASHIGLPKHYGAYHA